VDKLKRALNYLHHDISMRAPEVSVNESARIADLRTYGILDTASEEIFDEITALAAVICGTRFAGISFIDQDRQWFKSSYGVELQQSPRSESICGHAIFEYDIFEVENISDDVRFFDSPLLLGNPRFRFYAGSQIFSDRGNAIGMLCVLDSEPGKLSDSQRQSLKQLAHVIVSLLDARRLQFMASGLGSILNKVSQEVYLRDADTFKFLFANNEALRARGVSLEQLRASAPAAVDRDGDPSLFPDYIRRLRDGAPSVTFEGCGAGPTLQVTWQWLTSDSNAVILCVARDWRRSDRP
jgi:GAF domain-containing protein